MTRGMAYSSSLMIWALPSRFGSNEVAAGCKLQGLGQQKDQPKARSGLDSDFVPDSSDLVGGEGDKNTQEEGLNCVFWYFSFSSIIVHKFEHI